MLKPATTVPRIVVIEDNPADVRLLRQAFDELDQPYHFDVLADGEAALAFVAEQAQTEQPDPCLVIVDLHLPRYEGTVILEAIRQHSQLDQLKLAVLTTLASPAQEAAVTTLGVHLYRQKPSDWEQFCHLVRDLMALCHQQGQRAAFMS